MKPDKYLRILIIYIIRTLILPLEISQELNKLGEVTWTFIRTLLDLLSNDKENTPNTFAEVYGYTLAVKASYFYPVLSTSFWTNSAASKYPENI